MKKIKFNPNFCSQLGSITRIKEESMNECILCGRELERDEGDVCYSCFTALTTKYPKTKLEEVIKCHRKNARRLKK